MGCDIHFYKSVPEVKANDEGSNLLYITQDYEGIIPTPVGVEYIDLDTYFKGKKYQILSTIEDIIEVEVDGEILSLNHNDLPTYTKMKNTIPIEEIGYYRISYGGSFKRLNDSFTIGFSESDNKLFDIFDSYLKDEKYDVTPEYFKNTILVALKENGFESISTDLEKILTSLPETQIVYISY